MLQNELRLAALRHFTCGCTYAQKASKPDLIAAAAADGWNIALCLVTTQSTKIRNHLLTLQRQIVDTLLTCPSKMEEAVQLKQQYYLAMVHERSLEENWEAAHALVQEAFENVPTHLQKPLWRWRVIVMSKLGKNVLDGLAKLKENDPSLQVRFSCGYEVGLDNWKHCLTPGSSLCHPGPIIDRSKATTGWIPQDCGGEQSTLNKLFVYNSVVEVKFPSFLV